MTTRPDPITTRARARVSLGALITAHTAAQAGNAVTVLATPFFVLSRGGSALDVGIATTFATVPIIIGGPLGAVLIDRIGHKRSSIMADIASATTVSAIALLSSLGLLPFWGFLALIFASGLLDTPGQTARTVMLPDTASEAHVPLTRAVGFATSGERTATLIGAPLGGLLVSTLGPSNAFGVTAAFFVFSSLLVTTTVKNPLTTATDSPEDFRTSSYWDDLLQGLQFVSRQPLLRNIILIVFLMNLLDAARFSVLLPLKAADWTAGAAGVGLITGALGGGALLGSLAYGLIGNRMRRRPLFIAAFFITGAPVSLAFASTMPLTALIAIASIAGVAAGILNPIIGTLRLELAPPAMRARAHSLMIAGSWAGIPLGSLIAGSASEAFGLSACFIATGVIYAAAALSPLVGKTWKQMERN
ncbi:MFS transporter [Arthrobacter rhombi]|uniref:MFS transporter n=1 Tax=Arthrobacter rhombi TaxID=71253 RepID=UPI003FD3EF75